MSSYSTSVVKRANEQQKLEGAQAVRLIESAAAGKVRSIDPDVGQMIDVTG